jgi:hypothetical protein
MLVLLIILLPVYLLALMAIVDSLKPAKKTAAEPVKVKAQAAVIPSVKMLKAPVKPLELSYPRYQAIVIDADIPAVKLPRIDNQITIGACYA